MKWAITKEEKKRQRHVCLSPRKIFFLGREEATLDRMVWEGLPGEVNLRNEMESGGEKETKQQSLLTSASWASAKALTPK